MTKGVEQLSDYTDTQVAAPFINSSGNVLGSKIDATGFRRARFVFVFGTPLAGASVMAGAGIYNTIATGSSSGAFDLITGASFATSFTTATGSNQLAVIDVAVDQAKPWLIVSGFTVSNSNWIAGCIVDLYNADNSAYGTNYGDSPVYIVTT